MLPPNAPASASRSATASAARSAGRSRSASARASAMSSNNASLNSGAFSEATKLETKRLAGNKCWACNIPHTDVAHVLAIADDQLEIWKQHALFGDHFGYRSIENSVALCRPCHSEFDLANDPGFVFFPVDLQFFIKFEVDDQQRRQNGGDPRRQVPGADEYLAHHLRANPTALNVIGGLYRRVFLKPYVCGGESPEALRKVSEHNAWHGNPMASLRRAFAVLGTPRVYILGPEIRRELEQLRYMYFATDLPSPFDSTLCDIYGSSLIATSKRLAETEQNDQVAKRPKTDNVQLNNSETIPLNPQTHRQWVLGPDVTANTVIQLYAPLFSPA